jgi:hypothetical protein
LTAPALRATIGPGGEGNLAIMKKKLLALGTLVLAAGFLTQEAGPAPAASGPLTVSAVSSRLANVALSGVVVVLSPLGSMAGCGGGSSATAIALSEAAVRVGAADGPVTISAGSTGVSRLTVDDGRPTTSVGVEVRLSNPSGGRVRLSLRSPDGAEAVLFDGDTAGLVTSFDSASRADLAALVARSPQGEWSLSATSRGGATLESWSLSLRVRD